MRNFLLSVLLCATAAAHGETDIGTDAPVGECRTTMHMNVVMRAWGYNPVYVPRSSLNKLRQGDENMPAGDEAVLGVHDEKQAALLAIFRDGCMIGRGIIARDRAARLLTEQGT